MLVSGYDKPWVFKFSLEVPDGRSPLVQVCIGNIAKVISLRAPDETSSVKDPFLGEPYYDIVYGMPLTGKICFDGVSPDGEKGVIGNNICRSFFTPGLAKFIG